MGGVPRRQRWGGRPSGRDLTPEAGSFAARNVDSLLYWVGQGAVE